MSFNNVLSNFAANTCQDAFVFYSYSNITFKLKNLKINSIIYSFKLFLTPDKDEDVPSLCFPGGGCRSNGSRSVCGLRFLQHSGFWNNKSREVCCGGIPNKGNHYPKTD